MKIEIKNRFSSKVIAVYAATNAAAKGIKSSIINYGLTLIK